MPHHHHHDPHHHGPHHHAHGWLEHDSRVMTREEFGRELEALGKLIGENPEFTFKGVTRLKKVPQVCSLKFPTCGRVLL